MKVKFKSYATIRVVHPWLMHKEWWSVIDNGLPDFWKIVDPEVPSYLSYDGLHFSKTDVAAIQYADGSIQYFADPSVTITTVVPVTPRNSTGDYQYTLTAIDARGNVMSSADGNSWNISSCGSVNVGSGITISHDGSLNQAPMAKLKTLDDLDLSDVVCEFSAPKHKLVTCRIDVCAEAAYWQRFKGLASILDGLYLKFYPTEQRIPASGYEDTEVMLLASTKGVEFFDAYEGHHVEELRGLMIPSKFLVR